MLGGGYPAAEDVRHAAKDKYEDAKHAVKTAGIKAEAAAEEKKEEAKGLFAKILGKGKVGFAGSGRRLWLQHIAVDFSGGCG